MGQKIYFIQETIMELERQKQEVVQENEQNDLLAEYREQTQKNGKHDTHIDGYYSDYSESSCCC